MRLPAMKLASQDPLCFAIVAASDYDPGAHRSKFTECGQSMTRQPNGLYQCPAGHQRRFELVDKGLQGFLKEVQ